MSGASAVSGEAAIPITLEKLKNGIKPLRGGVTNYKFEKNELKNRPNAKPEHIFGDEVYQAVNHFIQETVEKTNTEPNACGSLKYMECILCKEFNFPNQTTFQKVSKYRTHLVSHLTIKEIGEKGPISCDVCGKKFTSIHSHDHHKLTSHGAKDRKVFDCDVCNFCTSTISKLKRHKLTHLEKWDRIKQCSYCGDRRTSDESLSQHVIKEHLVDKSEALRYICQFCHESFGKHADKENHVIENHGAKLDWLVKEKKEEQQELQEALLFLKDVHTAENVAKSLHIGVKNPGKMCSTCGRTFTERYTNHYHVKKYHPETVKGVEGCYECEICGKTGFSFLWEREAHKLLCHQSLLPCLKDKFAKRKKVVSIHVNNSVLVEAALELEGLLDRTNDTRNKLCFELSSDEEADISLDDPGIAASKNKKDKSDVKAEEVQVGSDSHEEAKRSLDKKKKKTDIKKVEKEQADCNSSRTPLEEANITQDDSEITKPKMKKKKRKKAKAREVEEEQVGSTSSRTPHEEVNRGLDDSEIATSRKKVRFEEEQDDSEITTPKKKKKKDKKKVKDEDAPHEEVNRALDDSETDTSKKKKKKIEEEQVGSNPYSTPHEEANIPQDDSEIPTPKKKKKKNKMRDLDGEKEIDSSKTSHEEANIPQDDSDIPTPKKKKKKNKMRDLDRETEIDSLKTSHEEANIPQDDSDIPSPKKKKKKNKMRVLDGETEIDLLKTSHEEANIPQDDSEIPTPKKKKKKDKNRNEDIDRQVEIDSYTRPHEKAKRALDDSEFQFPNSKKNKICSGATSPVMEQILDLFSMVDVNPVKC